ncbi:jouberin-like [Sitophilus oryzae]|uniref:Jouberin-like n=1 Tax=Sitophilus oryzae TaxID=7048 RepID=A0A6J2XDH3_SITOR|nr:jouberin-like [Sitophilus oryzae]
MSQNSSRSGSTFSVKSPNLLHKNRNDCNNQDISNNRVAKHDNFNDEAVSKELILNTFLSGSESVKSFKPPVPLPRKKLTELRRNSNSSTRTFDVTSPKILHNSDSVGDEDELLCIVTTNVSLTEKIHENEEQKLSSLDSLSETSEIIVKTSKIRSSKETKEKIQFAESIKARKHKYRRGKNKKLNDRQKIAKNLKELKSSDSETDNDTDSSKDIFKQPTQKNKIKKKNRNANREDVNSIEENTKSTNKNSDNESDQNEKSAFCYQNITEIIIHKSDRLLLNSFVIHPVVKIHVVDIRTGKYFKKSDKNRSVAFYYENEHNDYILPIMTNSYNLQENRSFYPKWEDTILLNEDFDYLVNENVIIFFEIMDFSTTNIATLRKNKEYDKGWYKIAFSFLKLVGKSNARNVNKKLQLQLYYNQNVSKKAEYDSCELWELWHKKKLKKYPSTLYVTVKEMISHRKIIEAFRSKTPLEKEDISHTTNDKNANDSISIKQKIEEDADSINAKLKNLSRQQSLIPHDFLYEINTFEDGCFVFKFSNNGKYLACSMKIENDFYIIFYMTDDFEEKRRYQSQEGLIYNIVWSADDNYLVTSSADNTVAIWDFTKSTFLQILPHSSFVYACDINNENTIASGCYDRKISLWILNKSALRYELDAELMKHSGLVTSVCFTKKKLNFLYSSDSCGEIIEWYKESDGQWNFSRSIDIVDIRGTKINEILLFPNEKKMLIHSRDSALRIISIKNSCVIQWLRGSLNVRVQTFCGISSNGFLVAAGSENGLVLIWEANNAKVVKALEGFSTASKTVHCVKFNPIMNMLAYSHYGSREPVVIYGSDKANKKTDIKNDRETTNLRSKDESNMEEICDYKRILERMEKLFIQGESLK